MIKLRQKNKYDTAYGLLKDKESGSDDGEETELFVRHKPHRVEIPTIEKIVETGDTLQALAIKYRCSVAELKRINNIHNENEIFAKIVIKVPHRPFTSALASVHVSGNSSPDLINVPSTSNLIDVDSVSLKLTESIATQKNDEVNEIIFNSQIAQKPTERLNPEETEEVDDSEKTHLLPQIANNVIETDPVISVLNCNGVDGGISWKLLIVFIFILIVALPLIYIFYIAEHLEEYHPHPHGS
ncbi:lysM and putative peptidoglycan-binding domain-containing protein 3 [Diorhabda carinulata]|uniref:lysM and putative peptidoglycan-binding domain-containing protein 3 n=1 Tax=Diorhabda carinulata TaxID=1163345 RepID=UPI0025A091B4|nr:lysM and putative peptidoglycan-binding domain-containing protein 3 [Diorhabda carinulata]